ncbi:hypothetical protein Tco_0034057 [Tanacetum coccineum]
MEKTDKDNDKGSKSKIAKHEGTSYNEDKDQEHSSLKTQSNLTDLMNEWSSMNSLRGRLIIACPNACEMWKDIERLKHGESINVQDLETNLYWEFRKFTSRDGESLESYYSSSSTKSQQAATRNRGKAVVNSSSPTYDQEPAMKIYKPTNNNLRTSSNTSRANQDNSPRFNRGTRYDNQMVVYVTGARENVGTQRDDTDDEPDDQELEAHYMYMAQIQEVTPDVADNSRPIFDSEPLQEKQGDTNITIDSLDMSTNGETVDQDDDDLAKECDFLSSLIEKLKCEIDDSKNRTKFLESSNKTLVNKLKSEIEDFKNKNKSLESSNNHFKEANNELSKTNQLMFKDLKKFQDELEKRHDVNYTLKVKLDCAKAKTELMSYKTESHKSINNYSYQINDLHQKIFDMKKELVAHQETISIMS